MQTQIFYSNRKTISLIITQNSDLVVRAPLGTSRKLINSIIEHKKEWIERKLDEIESNKALYKNLYKYGKEFYFLGKSLTFKTISASKKDVLLENQTLTVYLKKQANLKDIILKWYKKEAFDYILNRCNYYASILNCTFNKITITKAKKRLGSCDFKGNLRFSFYIILLDPLYIDYVVVHELCHLFYLNHSKAFWQKVESIMPDFRQIRLWIRKNFYIIANSV